MTRAFVAVEPPAAVLDAAEAVATRVASTVTSVRWTTREQRHLTLQFLGNRTDVDAVACALHDVAVPAGAVRLGGAGAFPSARRARVLWIGVAEGAALLSQLAAAVGGLLTPLGHEPEARPYHPHLTLARWKTPTDARVAVEAIGTAPVGDAWTVREIALYESRLRREGAQYVVHERVPLRA